MGTKQFNGTRTLSLTQEEQKLKVKVRGFKSFKAVARIGDWYEFYDKKGKYILFNPKTSISSPKFENYYEMVDVIVLENIEGAQAILNKESGKCSAWLFFERFLSGSNRIYFNIYTYYDLDLETMTVSCLKYEHERVID